MPWAETGTLSGLPEAPAGRLVSWKLLFPNLASDQGRIWTFPGRLVQGKNWIATTTVLGIAAGLVVLDPAGSSWFRRTGKFQGFNNVFSGDTTTRATILVPASFYVIGFLRKNSSMERTALLAGEAVVNAEILTTVLKGATKRARPIELPFPGNLSNSWFDSNGSAFRGTGSFPSGHSIAAFAVATVFASRYRQHRWVPYLAYGMATLVGFSRLTLSAHFMSDVFFGGALGYSISRFVVLRQ
jgi:membrane-associated phospholipid phosphatase